MRRSGYPKSVISRRTTTNASNLSSCPGLIEVATRSSFGYEVFLEVSGFRKPGGPKPSMRRPGGRFRIAQLRGRPEFATVARQIGPDVLSTLPVQNIDRRPFALSYFAIF